MAAVDLFAEHGYDATTVTQIAERAGVTKSTFFRHFPDKRELLVAGQEELSRRLAEGGVGLAAAMAEALVGRGLRAPTAQLAAEMGLLAFKRGFAAWLEDTSGDDTGLAPYTLTALEDLRAASASLG